MTERYIGIRWVVVWRSFRKKQNIHEEKKTVGLKPTDLVTPRFKKWSLYEMQNVYSGFIDIFPYNMMNSLDHFRQ
jgi:hypothetical protein